MENSQIAVRPTSNTIDIVFDGPPDHEAGRFVEVEQDGQSINVGEWIKRGDGYWALRIPYDRPVELSEARAIVREEQAANPRPSVEEWKAAERQIIAEKEESAARVNAASKAILDQQVANDEAMAKIVQRHTWLPADELAEVRADIMRTALVLSAFSQAILADHSCDAIDSEVEAAHTRAEDDLQRLLSRERELTAKTEPEGGDRG